MTPAACDQRLLVDSHFGSGLTLELERALRAHLPTCPACTAYYERYLLLSRLDPTALPIADRLGRGLGIAPQAQARGNRSPPRLLVALAIAAVGLIALAGPLRPQALDRLIARAGGGPSDVRVRVVEEGSAPSAKPLSEIGPDARLSFAYANQSNRRYLMIFGVDESETFYWYLPAWTDPSISPTSLAIEPTPTLRELPGAGQHHYDALGVHVVALFLKEPRTVRQVEENVSHSPDERPHFDDQITWETDLRIKRP